MFLVYWHIRAALLTESLSNHALMNIAPAPRRLVVFIAMAIALAFKRHGTLRGTAQLIECPWIALASEGSPYDIAHDGEKPSGAIAHADVLDS